jgi:hypothetical protein
LQVDEEGANGKRQCTQEHRFRAAAVIPGQGPALAKIAAPGAEDKKQRRRKRDGPGQALFHHDSKDGVVGG